MLYNKTIMLDTKWFSDIQKPICPCYILPKSRWFRYVNILQNNELGGAHGHNGIVNDINISQHIIKR